MVESSTAVTRATGLTAFSSSLDRHGAALVAESPLTRSNKPDVVSGILHAVITRQQERFRSGGQIAGTKRTLKRGRVAIDSPPSFWYNNL